MYFPCLFLYNVPCCFYSVIRFCYRPTVVFSLASFITFLRILQYLIQCAFAFGLLPFFVKPYRLLLCMHDTLIPCVIQSFLSFILFPLTRKLAWKMLKKVHRNELHIWLGSVSTQTDLQVSFFCRAFKFLVVSLSIKLFLCFKGNLFTVAYIFLILYNLSIMV